MGFSNLACEHVCDEGVLVYLHLNDVVVQAENTAGSAVKVPTNFKESAIVTGVECLTMEDHQYIVVTSSEGLEVWRFLDVQRFRLSSMLKISSVPGVSGDSDFLRGAATSPLDWSVLVGTSLGSLVVLDVRGMGVAKVKRSIKGLHRAPVSQVRASRRFALSACEEGSVVLIDLMNDYDHRQVLAEDGVPCTALAINEDLAAVSSASGAFRILGLSAGQVIAQVDAHSRAIAAVDFHPTEPLLLSAGEDSFIHVWRIPESEAASDHTKVTLAHTEEAPNRLLCGARFSRSDGDQLCAVAYDHDRLLIWRRR